MNHNPAPRIVFEDEEILVLDKPAGIVVNRAESVHEPTVQDWVEHYLHLHFSLEDDFKKRSGIAHRLDKETSGLLLVAKTPESLIPLLAQFKDRTIEKQYMALTHGKVAPSQGAVNAPIGRLPWNTIKFGVFAGGRESSTEYSVRSLWRSPKDELVSLLDVHPFTGRTHQIRVHLQYIQHPIVGDTIYGGRKRLREDMTWCPRLFLHAAKLSFVHPKNAVRMSMESPLAEDLQQTLDQLTPEKT